MAPQPAGPLNDQVNRRQIGDHQIEIDVERLLGDLGGHEDAPVALFGRRARTEQLQCRALDLEPVEQRELRMEQHRIEANRRQGAMRLVGIPHRVAQVEDGASCFCRRACFLDRAVTVS